MGWRYDPTYVGPDRRSKRFEVRFVERRRAEGDGPRASLQAALRGLAARGLRWVDHLNYFGPDRRSGVFSFFFFERRRQLLGASPPPMHAALRQLRVRVIEAQDEPRRQALRERLIATAVLAEAQGRSAIGDVLTELAALLNTAPANADLRPLLERRLIEAETMLDS